MCTEVLELQSLVNCHLSFQIPLLSHRRLLSFPKADAANWILLDIFTTIVPLLEMVLLVNLCTSTSGVPSRRTTRGFNFFVMGVLD